MTWADAARTSRRNHDEPSGTVRVLPTPGAATPRTAVATITRPAKFGGTPTYVQEVLAGYNIIRDNEVDADLDGVYAGHNTLVNAFNALVSSMPSALPPSGPAGGDLLGSSYPNPRIAPGAVTTPALADANVTDAKIANVSYSKLLNAPTIPTALPPVGPAGGALQGAYPNPSLNPSALPTTLPPSGPCGGDLTGSTYPNPVIATGKVSRAKLGSDVSGVVVADLATPTVGPNTAGWTPLLDLQSTTLLPSRFYELALFGNFNKGVTTDLSITVYVANVNVFYVTFSPAAQNDPTSYFSFRLQFAIIGSNVWSNGWLGISAGVSAGAQANAFTRAYMKNGYTTGAATQGPFVEIAFAVAATNNTLTRYGATLAVL